MKSCNNNHTQIIHTVGNRPLCRSNKQNNEALDFIKKLRLNHEFIYYQTMKHQLTKIALAAKEAVEGCYKKRSTKGK